jgi:hypothetical protein
VRSLNFGDFDRQPNAGSEGGRDKFFLKRNVNVKWNVPRLVEHEGDVIKHANFYSSDPILNLEEVGWMFKVNI